MYEDTNPISEKESLRQVVRRFRMLKLPGMRPTFRSKLRAQLMNTFTQSAEPVTFRDSLRHIWQMVQVLSLRSKPMTITIILALIFTLTGGGTVYASQSTLPGDVLYGVKTGIEDIWLVVTPADDKMGLYVNFALERVAEIQALIAEGRYEDIAQAAQRFAELYQHAEGHPGADGLEIAATQAINTLTAVLAIVPEPARPAIELALQLVSERGDDEDEIEMDQEDNGPPAGVPVGPPPGVPVGTPADVPVGPPADAPVGPPADVPVGPPPNVPGGPPPDVPGGPPPNVPGGPPASPPVPPGRP